MLELQWILQSELTAQFESHCILISMVGYLPPVLHYFICAQSSSLKADLHLTSATSVDTKVVWDKVKLRYRLARR